MDVYGKVAIVTGSARGLGKAFTEAILKAGGKVCLCDIEVEEGSKTLQQFQALYGKENAIFVSCDVTDQNSFDNVFRKTLENYGRIDIVVNNAGLLSEANVRRTIMVNLVGVIEGTNLATKYLSKRTGGHGGLVINISSTAGLTPVFYMPVYVASKYGVVGFTRSVSQNPANKDSGVRYTCLCPGFTETEAFEQNHQDLPPGIDPTYIQAAKKLVTKAGINTVEDVVKGLMTLLTVDNNNGAVMVVTKNFGISYRYGKPLSHKL